MERNHELLTRDELFQLEADFLAQVEGVVPVNQSAQCIDSIAVQHDVQFDEVGWFVFVREVIERCIATGDGLQFVVEVKDNFAKGHAEAQFDPV